MLRPSLIICRMAGTPSAVPGIFTNRLGELDPAVQRPGGFDAGAGVVGESGRHLQRHEAVRATARVVQRSQHAERIDDVVDDQLPVGLLH